MPTRHATHGGDLKMKLAGVTLHEFVKVGLLAVLFIILLKTVAARAPQVPGLQSLAGAV
jgi:hypothetical protein